MLVMMCNLTSKRSFVVVSILKIREDIQVYNYFIFQYSPASMFDIVKQMDHGTELFTRHLKDEQHSSV